MTREEAIDLLDNLIGIVEDNHKSDYDMALQMAIQALEQEPKTDILDKIRAEIDKWHHLTDKAFNDGIDTALEIIDKYKAERSDKE